MFKKRPQKEYKPYRISNKNEYYDPLYNEGFAPKREAVLVSEIQRVGYKSFANYRFKVVKEGEVCEQSVAAVDYGSALVTLHLNIKDESVDLQIESLIIKDILSHTVRENAHLSAALIMGIVYGSKGERGVPVTDISDYSIDKAGWDTEKLKKELGFALNFPGLRRELACSDGHYLLDKYNDKDMTFEEGKILFLEIMAITGLYPVFLNDMYKYIVEIYHDVNKPDPEDDMVLEDI